MWQHGPGGFLKAARYASDSAVSVSALVLPAVAPELRRALRDAVWLVCRPRLLHSMLRMVGFTYENLPHELRRL